MNLSRYTLKNISPDKVIVPDAEIFDLPEKVLQFGTGRLLRGLPDYFIDKANSMGIFNGRIVMVKTTSRGDAAAFDRQDGLYTLCERGIDDGEKVEENIICSAVNRVLIAHDHWTQILECAYNENLKIIISNTTEVGIHLVKDDIRRHPPVSFPGKLLAFLYERFIAFNGSEESGFVIVPTELILENAKKLEAIVLELAHLNSLEDRFIEWVEKYNYFCNSLVDRIVTGIPNDKIKTEIESDLGYNDELLTVSEIYSLWAIEGDEKIKSILSFAEADERVVIEPNIELHRELKLRLLNGTHTLSCGVAFFAGCETVQEAMKDEIVEAYMEDVMRSEIALSIPYEIDDESKEVFISKVLDRFRNPHINHYWKNISVNYTSKMMLRCIPLLLNYYKKNDAVPPLMAFGFASYIYFMKAVKQTSEGYFGEFEGESYLIDDELAEKFYLLWKSKSIEGVVKEALKNTSIWGEDLSQLPSFEETIIENLNSIIQEGMKASLEKVHPKKNVA